MGEVKLVGEDVGWVSVGVVHGSELMGEITGFLVFWRGTETHWRDLEAHAKVTLSPGQRFSAREF
jgi:hypothetical protein